MTPNMISSPLGRCSSANLAGSVSHLMFAYDPERTFTLQVETYQMRVGCLSLLPLDARVVYDFRPALKVGLY